MMMMIVMMVMMNMMVDDDSDAGDDDDNCHFYRAVFHRQVCAYRAYQINNNVYIKPQKYI